MFLSCCAVPPKSAYIDADPQGAASTQLGLNAAGEPCTQSALGGGRYALYCGSWTRPSARLRRVPATADLHQLATASPWRRALDNDYDCGAPRDTTLLSGPAVLLQCTRLLEGFPQLAFAVRVDGDVWLADGVPAAAPVMERAVALNTGRAASVGNAADSPGLAAARLANRAVSASEIGTFDTLLRAAGAANQAGDYAAAEEAYRRTLTLQRRLLGADSPATARTLALVALQVSNQHRFDEADAMLRQAAALAGQDGAADDRTLALVWHYQGLNLLNQGRARDAIGRLRRAEEAYLRLVPADVGAGSPDSDLVPDDPVTKAAAYGVVETERASAVAYRMLGAPSAGLQAMARAERNVRLYGLSNPTEAARIMRTAASLDDAAGRRRTALDEWQVAADRFAQALPGSRSYGETQLLLAARLAEDGQGAAALAACRVAAHVLRGAGAGVTADRLAPCLDQMAAAAARGDQAAAREMFSLGQLAQGGTTSQQIALVSARLAENARDPKVARLIRGRDDANAALARLYIARDDAGAGSAAASALTRQIEAAERTRDQQEDALQSAAPNYGQLVQRAVSADDILRVLRPGEVFASFVLASGRGWTFVLRRSAGAGGSVAVVPVAGGAAQVDALVARIRAALDGPAADGSLRPFDTAAAAALYTALFGGATALLAGATALVVAPSGTLLSVPFGLLLTGPARPDALAAAPWLIRSVVVSHVPAPANFVQLRGLAGTSRATRPWFGFGDFRPVSQRQAEASFPPAMCGDSARLLAGLQLLPGTRAELTQAKAVLGATGRDELLGPAFTAAAVLGADLQPYRVLHFATHALLQSDLACQAEPALVTSAPPGARDAQGALLTASQVAGLKLDADAVLLSACNTGGPGGSAPGESLSGLARSFFYAGARALLVTHWDVDDRVTSVLVTATLGYAKADPSLGMAGALALAQRRLLAKAATDLPNLAHPFFWAPLALIGDGGN